jgi:hypothetical protein
MSTKKKNKKSFCLEFPTSPTFPKKENQFQNKCKYGIFSSATDALIAAVA